MKIKQSCLFSESSLIMSLARNILLFVYFDQSNVRKNLKVRQNWVIFNCLVLSSKLAPLEFLKKKIILKKATLNRRWPRHFSIICKKSLQDISNERPLSGPSF